jgi:hypothetical protein
MRHEFVSFVLSDDAALDTLPGSCYVVVSVARLHRRQLASSMDADA